MKQKYSSTYSIMDEVDVLCHYKNIVSSVLPLDILKLPGIFMFWSFPTRDLWISLDSLSLLGIFPITITSGELYNSYKKPRCLKNKLIFSVVMWLHLRLICITSPEDWGILLHNRFVKQFSVSPTYRQFSWCYPWHYVLVSKAIFFSFFVIKAVFQLFSGTSSVIVNYWATFWM